MKGLHALPPGVDFAAEIARGLRARVPDPTALARVTLLVNTSRMARRIEAAFADGPATPLPRIGLVSDIAALLPPTVPLPDTTPPLALRLHLTQLTRGLLHADPNLSPPSAAFDLAGSLQTLLEEMQEEAADPDRLADLVPGDHATHWQRSLTFLTIATGWLGDGATTTEAGRQAAALAALRALWADAPPADPILIAGSTGSRGATRALIAAVLALPQGGVVLPGLDRDMPDAAWAALLDPPSQDHPQYRHAALLAAHDRTRADIPDWTEAAPASAARNRLLSLALRPAPTTDAWLDEGPALEGVRDACADVTLVRAASPAQEAAAIALGLRAALEDGKRAALITPDRNLSRQVAAQLDRWGIEPDDSAGTPLVQSAPGRLLTQLANLRDRPLEAEGLIALLKHPKTHSNDAREPHLRRTRRLELELIRKRGLAFPTRRAILDWASEHDRVDPWTEWLADWVQAMAGQPLLAPLADHAQAHLDLVQDLSAGSPIAEDDTRPTGTLWDGPAGREARAALERLLAASDTDPTPIHASEYARILHAVLAAEEVRDPYSPHPDVMIWGALEARVRTADLVILGGLTDGIWPAQPSPDPWLNRSLRADLGLRLPDREIGLSAHDFQLAAAGPAIWLSHATRDAETATVPSRWLNRLTGLLAGIGEEGAAALQAMEARGNRWCALADHLDATDARHDARPAPRPAPKPPTDVRPTTLSVTAVETLIRDPYAIYARHILRLRALDPLRQSPDARLRGSAVHAAMDRFIATQDGPPGEEAAAELRAALEQVLEAEAPWPAHRRLWLGKLDRVAPDLLAAEGTRLAQGRPLVLEGRGEMSVPGTDVTLIARADRLDDQGDAIAIYDYKTGQLPGKKEQEAYAKQLLLEALIVRAGGFRSLGPRTVSTTAYLGVGSSYKEAPMAIDDALLNGVQADLATLLRAYADGAPYIARLAPKFLTFGSDYDHLSRYGEWDDTEAAQILPVGR